MPESSRNMEKESNKLMNLDETVVDALGFFDKNPPPQFNLEGFKFPFVVGSGNAYNTGQILFSGREAILADESSFREIAATYSDLIRDRKITEAVVISSSGEKDSVWEIELAKKLGLKTTLFTCKPNSSAAARADETIAFRSIAEPYTYNTSTYLGMMLAAFKEKPKEILKLINEIRLPTRFGDYQAYVFILPDNLIHLCPMLDVKKDELFGPNLSLRAFTQGHARHAKFVHPTPNELVIGVGTDNKYFGLPQHRWAVDIPGRVGYPTAMALTYFLVGKIQQAKPPFFKDDIGKFCEMAPLAYGGNKPFDVIVPGN